MHLKSPRSNHIPKAISTILILAIIILPTYNSDINPSCKDVPGIGAPVNIFHSYFQNFFSSMSLGKTQSGVELILFNEQNIESLVYRFIFRYTNTRNKTYFIGILSTIPDDQINEPNPEHMIVRFIQSSDLNDTQRLLGLYNVNANNANDCDYKNKFWNQINAKPLFEQETRPKPPMGSQNIVEGSVSEAGPVFKQQNNYQGADGMQAISDLLSSITGNQPQDNTNTITNYRIITTSTMQHEQDPLKALLSTNNTPSNSMAPFALSQASHTQPYQSINTNNSNIMTNSQQFIMPYANNGSGNGNNIQFVLNQLKQLEPSGSQPNTTNVKYSSQTRYTLGSVLSGTGKDKIMNPQIVNENNG